MGVMAERSVQRPGMPVPRSDIPCRFWQKGKCSKNHACRFMHGDSPANLVYHRDSKQSQTLPEDPQRATAPGYSLNNSSKSNGSASAGYVALKTQDRKILRKIPSQGPKNVWRAEGRSSDAKVVEKSQLRIPLRKIPDNSCEDFLSVITEVSTTGEKVAPRIQNKRICDNWISGNCVHGEKCCFHHAWFLGDDFTMVANLEGHKKAVTGIALPSGSDKLYTSSIDGTARIWDCNSGQCSTAEDFRVDVGSLICEGPWLFVGMPNVVLAWNGQSGALFHLNGPVGQVHVLIVANDMLFAGDQNGVILAWKDSCSAANPFQLAASFRGHTRSVMCLSVAMKYLYSGSADHTIRMWDLDTLECVHTLSGHTEEVTSLLCWDQYLVSCSLDKTIKVWAGTEQGGVEVTYTHYEEHGGVALFGMHDAEAKPILFCSCDDNTVRLYDLPTFKERGRIFSKGQVGVIQMGPGGLFFTGDATGSLTVWKQQPKQMALGSTNM